MEASFLAVSGGSRPREEALQQQMNLVLQAQQQLCQQFAVADALRSEIAAAQAQAATATAALHREQARALHMQQHLRTCQTDLAMAGLPDR